MTNRFDPFAEIAWRPADGPCFTPAVELFEGEARMRRKLCQTGALQADIIVRVEIVEPMNDRPGGKQAGG